MAEPNESLAAPFIRLGDDCAVHLAARLWGLDVHATRRFDTERDDTFLLVLPETRYVLKIAHPLDDRSVIDLQCSALAHSARRDPSLPLPQVVPCQQGLHLHEVAGAEGEPRIARLLTYLPGSALDYSASTAAQRCAIGAAQARLSRALADFEHPASSRFLHFDLKRFGDLRPLLSNVQAVQTRRDVELTLDSFDGFVGPALKATRQQVVHHDLNADNLLVDPSDAGYVTGILDFGDMVHSSLVGDLAVSMSYAVGGGLNASPTTNENPWSAPYDLVAGFETVLPLTSSERELLPHLVRTRLAQRLLLNSWLVATNPENAHYTGRTIPWCATALTALIDTPVREDGYNREGA